MNTKIETALKTAGFAVANTGGGCTAWELSMPNDHYMWITSADDPSHDLDPTVGACIGIYNAEGEAIFTFTTKDFTTMFTAINEAQLKAAGFVYESFMDVWIKQAGTWVATISNGQSINGNAWEVSITVDGVSVDSTPEGDNTVEEAIDFALKALEPKLLDPATTVRGNIDQRFDLLDEAILDCPVDSCVGSSVVDVCAKAIALIDTQAADQTDGGLEHDVACQIIAAVVQQCNVWYFG